MIRGILTIVLCWSVCIYANETISLTKYLLRANAAGHNIVFSSALVRSYYEVTFNPDAPLTIDSIELAVRAFDLDLVKTDNQTYLVIAQAEVPSAPKKIVKIEPYSSIEEVIVNSSLHQFTMENISNSNVIDQANLLKRPTIANDPLRATNRLPGAANNGVSGRSAIRGGRINETLITLDGMRLYEPYHLHVFNDLFSVVDARTVNSLNYTTGGFPSKYGDRLSGVMSIESINPEEDQKEIGVGLYMASYLQNGADDNRRYFVSLRRSTIDLFGNLANSDYGTPAFSDLHIYYQRSLGSKLEVSGNLLWFGDDLSINNSSKTEKSDSTYGNTYLWFALQHNPAEGRSSETRITFTAIKDDRDGKIDKPGMIQGKLSDDREFRIYSIEHKMLFERSNSLLEVGATYRYLDAEYGLDSTLSVDPAFSDISNYPRPEQQKVSINEYGQQVAFYASLKYRLAAPLYVEAGIRMDSQDYITSGWTKQVTPRVSILYRFTYGGEVRWSWGKFSQAQGIHELDLSDGISVFQRPQKAKHLVLSYQQSFGNIDFRVEGYEKETHDTNLYFENLTDPISLVPELQVDRSLVAPSNVTARGVEISISGQYGENEFWLNYTRSEVEERISGSSVSRSSDQKHAANLGWSREFGNWQFAMESSYHSGWPTTELVQDPNGNVPRPVRNDRRLPHYLTVDIKSSRQWELRNKSLRMEIGITNLLNRDNQVGTEYKLANGQLKPSKSYSIPIAPFLDFYLTF